MQRGNTHRWVIKTLSACVVGTVLLFVVARTQPLPQGSLAAFPPEPDSISARAGKVVTVAFRVANVSVDTLHCTAQLVLPIGWRSLTGRDVFPLAGLAQELRLASFSIPSGSTPGTYSVGFALSGDTTSSEFVSARVCVIVTEERKIRARIVSAPRFVSSGKEYVVTYRVINDGNVPLPIRVRAKPGGSSVIRLDSTAFNIPPKEERDVPLVVTTSPGANSRLRDIVFLTAEVVGDSSISVSTSSSVDVIPVGSTAAVEYRTFPMEATARLGGGENTSGLQGEIRGSGSLTEHEPGQLDFLFRAPDLLQHTILGLRDEYRLTYRTGSYDVYGGDLIYSLSPLTEYQRYAFGGGGSLRVDDVSFGGFYNKTRFLYPIEQEQAGFLTYHPDESANFSLLYLGKRLAENTDLLSFRTSVNPTTLSNVDVEYARGFTGGEIDEATSLRVAGRNDWASGDVRYVHADPGYRGYYRDINSKSATLNFFPVNGVRLEGLYRDEERNLDRDTSLFVAPRYRNWQIGAGFSNILTVFFKSNLQEDLLPNPKYQRDDAAFQVMAGYTLPFASLLGIAEFGRSRERTIDAEAPYRRVALYANTWPTASVSVGFSIDYLNDRNLFTAEPQERISGSVNARIDIPTGTRLLFTVSGSETRSTLVQTFNALDVTLEQELPFGHRVRLQSRQTHYTPSSNGGEFDYLVEYTIPINVSIGRSSTTGSLRGTLMDNETGKGVAEVIITIDGQMALTDERGEFFFPVLRPGTYDFTIDFATLGVNHVLATDAPRGVPVRGGEETEVTLGVLRASTVSGDIVRHAFESPEPVDSLHERYVEAGGQSAMLIEVSNGSVVYRQMSDSRGHFEFRGLPAGSWRVAVIGGEIPEHHFIKEDSAHVLVRPGEDQKVRFDLFPKRRKIQFIQIQEAPTQLVAPPAAPEPVPTEPAENYVIMPNSGGTGFYIQLSSWKSEEKASVEAQKVEQATGRRTMVRKKTTSSGNVLYQVRLTGFATREEAEATVKDLQGLQ